MNSFTMANNNYSEKYNFTEELMDNVTINITDFNQHSTEDIIIYDTFSKPIQIMILLGMAYFVVFVLAIMGNCMVIGVVYRNTCMHSVTNYLLVNLAVADILVSIFCLPITLVYNLFTSWPFGLVVCKTTPFLQGVAVSASVNTLVVIALDRYFAICHTLNFKISKKACRIIITVIWIGSAAIMAPWAVFFTEIPHEQPGNQTIYTCNEIWPDKTYQQAYFLGAILLTCYSIPLFLITICYTLIGVKICRRRVPGVQDSSVVVKKSKIKVVKMLIVVVALFAFLWLPLYVMTVIILFSPEPHDNESMRSLYEVAPWLQWLGLSQCCVNPLIYCLFSNKYRQGFKVLIKCKDSTYFRRDSSRSQLRDSAAGTVRSNGAGDSTPTEKKKLLHRISNGIGKSILKQPSINTEDSFL